MKSRSGTKSKVGLKQAMWVKMPRTGQVVKTLDKNGVAHVRGENPEFAGAPYCVHLGLRARERGSQLRFGTLDSYREGDYFYAEVQKKGSFDIHLKAQSLSNQEVTIQWWAIPESWTYALTIGPTTLGPTPVPTPVPTIRPTGSGIERFDQKDFPGRYVDEIPGIGPESVRRLTKGRMKSLAKLASADFRRVAQILSISEVRAMSFVDQARRLLRGKSRK